MRIVALYHQDGEHSLDVENYTQDFRQEQPTGQIELIPLETPEGAQLAQLYAVNQYPAVLVTSDDGSLVRLWQGMPLPLMSELAQYA